MLGLEQRGLLPALMAVAGLTLAPVAQASTLPLSLAQLTDASDFVVRGTVSQMWVDTDERGYHWTRVQLEVDAVFKGPVETDALQLDVMGGFLGTEGTISHESPRFDVGEPVLVFAEQLESGLLVPTGLEQGKLTIRVDPDSGREMLVQFNPEPHLAYDHRFIPHPDPAARVFLSDVVGLVETRVEQGWDGEPIPGKSQQRLLEMHPGAEVTR
jgi:hypothetical protein